MPVLTLVLLILSGCDSRRTRIFLDNRSSEDNCIRIPDYVPGPSSVIKSGSRSLVSDHQFVMSGIDVIYEIGSSHKRLLTCRFTRADLDTRFKGNDLTFEYPPSSEVLVIENPEPKGSRGRHVGG